MMRIIISFLLGIIIMAGCSTGKTAAEKAAEKQAYHIADSIKYEAVREAFVNGEFVFRFTQKHGKRVSPVDNYISVSMADSTIMYQYVVNKIPPIINIKGKISDVWISHDPKKKITKFSMDTPGLYGNFDFGSINFRGITVSLYDDSNSAYIEWARGYIEPLRKSPVVQGYDPMFKL